jgi:hypothetical protein
MFFANIKIFVNFFFGEIQNILVKYFQMMNFGPPKKKKNHKTVVPFAMKAVLVLLALGAAMAQSFVNV